MMIQPDYRPENQLCNQHPPLKTSRSLASGQLHPWLSRKPQRLLHSTNLLHGYSTSNSFRKLPLITIRALAFSCSRIVWLSLRRKLLRKLLHLTRFWLIWGCAWNKSHEMLDPVFSPFISRFIRIRDNSSRLKWFSFCCTSLVCVHPPFTPCRNCTQRSRRIRSHMCFSRSPIDLIANDFAELPGRRGARRRFIGIYAIGSTQLEATRNQLLIDSVWFIHINIVHRSALRESRG